MHIDLPDSLRALRDLSHDEPTRRPAQIPPGLANVVAEHLALHGAGDRLRESLVQWGDEQGSTGGQSRFGWRNPQDRLAAETADPLRLVLEDILEEINSGTGSNLDVDIDDAYSNEDLFNDLAQMFAHRRQPIGDNDLDSQSDFGSANNPFCGALFGAWEMEGDHATRRGRHDASLSLLLKIIAVLGRRKLLTLLDIDEGDGQARYEPDDQDLLFEIAAFMDQHPTRYPPPATLDAERWTWTERIARGTALDARETRLFQLALEELDFALARLAGQQAPIRQRVRRSREEIEFHLSVTGSARNVLRLMCA
ncbi:harpin HrpZ family protein [Pseudomonas bijieensis]|uniref:harpin HrpZ family protein n=1 Tax=Pseudomonas bijieensis TaxID=2681983 RepID=UPI001E363D43|nr:harpin HrpZ family protein [Pseudomonas bijieensis]MCD9114042.1 harpin HrpZ family protein [Pseudomonas bijieensis]